MKEHAEILNTNVDTKIDDFKYEASISINKTFSPINSNNQPSSYKKSSADINKGPLLKSPYPHSHASQFTKHLSPITLEGDTPIQFKKWLDAIRSEFFQYLSTNKSCPPYKKFKAENYDIAKFLLPPDTQS